MSSYFGELARGGASPRAESTGSHSRGGSAAAAANPLDADGAEGAGAAPKPGGAPKPTKVKTPQGKAATSGAKTPTWLQRGVAADGRANTRTIDLNKVCSIVSHC